MSGIEELAALAGIIAWVVKASAQAEKDEKVRLQIEKELDKAKGEYAKLDGRTKAGKEVKALINDLEASLSSHNLKATWNRVKGAFKQGE